VFRAVIRRLIAGEPRERVVAELRADAERAFDQLDEGLAGYGRR
jgi:hypothetical protein